jgi:hypothetical protein
MRGLFSGGGSSQHESRRQNVYYEDPVTRRRATSVGKAHRSQPIRYMDRNTGREVDERGRPIYTV